MRGPPMTAGFKTFCKDPIVYSTGDMAPEDTGSAKPSPGRTHMVQGDVDLAKFSPAQAYVPRLGRNDCLAWWQTSSKSSSVVQHQQQTSSCMPSRASPTYPTTHLNRLCDMMQQQKVFQSIAFNQLRKLQEQGLEMQQELDALRSAMASRHGQERKAENQDDEGADDSQVLEPAEIAVGLQEEESFEKKNSEAKLQKGATIEMIMKAQEQHVADMAANKAKDEEHVASWKQWVRGSRFDMLVGGIIGFNVIVMSLELEYEGQMLEDYVMHGGQKGSIESVKTTLFVLEHFFTAFFAGELLLRLAADGKRYMGSPANWADACIVVICSLDSWVFTPMGSDQMGDVAILRLLRLVRLTKVFRVVRVMKAFHSLRVLVSAILQSLGALVWSMTLLFILELSGSILMARVLMPYMEDPKLKEETRTFLWTRFGTCYRSFLSMFEITMAPGAFLAYRRMYDEVSQVLSLFFVVYCVLVTFAVVRVITAMFLKATLSASDKDSEQISLIKEERHRKYAEFLQQTVRETKEQNCTLNKRDLSTLLRQDQMKEWMSDADMTEFDEVMLTQALDDGHGNISFEDFVNALKRMRGPPRSADTVVQLYEIRKIYDRILKLEHVLVGKPSYETKTTWAPVSTGGAPLIDRLLQTPPNGNNPNSSVRDEQEHDDHNGDLNMRAAAAVVA